MNLVETKVTQIDYKDENGENHVYSMVPIVTVPDEKIEKVEGKERRIEKLWNNFYKNVHKELEIIDDVKLDSENAGSFSDYESDQYAFVDFDSLYALNERRRESYSLGMLYAEETDNLTYIAKSFSDEFIEKLDIEGLETLDKNVPFEYIESARDKAIKTLQLMSKEHERKILEESTSNTAEESENSKKDEEYSMDSNIEDKEYENNVHEDSSNEEYNSRELTNNTRYEEVEEYENGEEVEEVEEVEEQSDIVKLQNDLYNTIDNLIPRIYLDDINIDLEFRNENKHSVYTELENLTIDNIRKNKQRTLERLKEERQSIVDGLYRKASTSLYRRYTDIEKLFNFESPESEYYHEYQQIKDSYERVLDSAEGQREEKFVELTRKFEKDMERRAKSAYEQEKAKIEREERPLVEQEADNYLKDLRQETENIFENQKDSLINDINMTFESRYHGIVDEVLDEIQPQIDKEVNVFDESTEESTAYILQKYQNDMKEVQQKIQDIEKDHIQNETEFDRRVKMEVERKTQAIREENRDYERDNDSMKEELERLRRQVKQNEGYIENLQLENKKKDERLRISESDVEHYKKQLLNHNQLGYDNPNNHSNFNNVVAPNSEMNQGVGNQRDNVVATEKVVAPLKNKLKHPLMITLYAISVSSVGLLGISSIDNNEEQSNKPVNNQLSNIEKFKKTNEAKYLGDNTTLTIKADNRLKPSQVESKTGHSVKVKSFDGKSYTLKN